MPPWYRIAVRGSYWHDRVRRAAWKAPLEAERRELDWLLTSGVLGRSGNLTRVLKYICEERFAGRAHQIKEYTIATEALGRRPDFDPNSDTIVRVTFHSLRKRLVEVYQNEGADRRLWLVVPAGALRPALYFDAANGSAALADPSQGAERGAHRARQGPLRTVACSLRAPCGHGCD